MIEDNNVSNNFPEALCSKKIEILRAIESEITGDDMVFETILENLEIVEELDRALGNAKSASLSSAYCMVALECTTKFLVADDGKPGLKYLNAFDRIWRRRIKRLETCGESELVTSDLKKWRDDLQLSVYDRNACAKLCGLNTRNEALRLVWVYLEEEGLGLEGVCSPNAGNESGFRDDRKVVDGGMASPDAMDAESRGRGRTLDRINDVKDSEFEELGNDHTVVGVVLPDPVGEVLDVEEEVSVELQPDVIQPSPNSLLGAEIMMSLSTSNTNSEPTLESWNEKEVDEDYQNLQQIIDKCVQTSIVNIGKPTHKTRDNVPRPNLRERKSTAPTYEWDDPTGGSPEATTSSRRRISTVRPKRKAGASLLMENESPKVSMRRKTRRWSLREEETLRNAVMRFGNCWKFILTTHHEEFEERTEVDLKDKWRNMTKYSHC